MSTQPFASSNINTGVTFSTTGPKINEALANVVAPSGEGYYTPSAGYIEVAGKKVMGLSCDKGYFYPASLGKEAAVVLDSLVERGYAYVSGPDSK